MLTLSGPLGVGKTHLALHLAHELAGKFPDDALFVPLEDLTGADRVLPALASALRLTDPGASSTDLELALRRRMLLILNNFEHLLAAAPALARLVQAAPDITVLVTSQARLRIRGERSYLVRSLPYPEPGDQVAQQLTPDQLANYPAVQLFLARARERDPDFSLTAGQAEAVAAICQRLDGLPLAIELAAARSVVMAPTRLLSRLERSLAVLTGGSADLPERQRTLRSALAWSYELLSSSEGCLFRALGVFVGGWTLESAVIAADDAPGGCATR